MRIRLSVYNLLVNVFGRLKNYSEEKIRVHKGGVRRDYMVLIKNKNKPSNKTFRQDLNRWEQKRTLGYLYTIFLNGSQIREFTFFRK